MQPKDADSPGATPRASSRCILFTRAKTSLTQNLLRLALILASLGGSLGASASEPQDERWYQVEVIVFKRLNAPVDAPASGVLSPTFPQPLFAVSPHEMSAAQPMLIEQALYLDQSGGLSGLPKDLSPIQPVPPHCEHHI